MTRTQTRTTTPTTTTTTLMAVWDPWWKVVRSEMETQEFSCATAAAAAAEFGEITRMTGLRRRRPRASTSTSPRNEHLLQKLGLYTSKCSAKRAIRPTVVVDAAMRFCSGRLQTGPTVESWLVYGTTYTHVLPAQPPSKPREWSTSSPSRYVLPLPCDSSLTKLD